MLEGIGNSRVSVSVRVRPTLKDAVSDVHRMERYQRVACITTSDTGLRLWDGRPAKESRSAAFSFDNVFAMDTSQADVYEATAVDAVDAVLAGANASILAYGQTGSGKTYTVLGGIQGNPLTNDIVTEDTGVLMRAVDELLRYAARMREKKRCHVILGISVVEIYLEEVRDLLSSKSSQGAVVNTAVVKDVVRLPGLTCAPLNTLVDAMDVYRRAASRRVQRATSANNTSSRSHGVFSMEVFQVPFSATPPSLEECLRARDDYVAALLDPMQRAVKPVRCPMFEGAANPLLGSDARPIMYSKLTVADLAGSEKAKHSDVRGEGFEELRKINSSLTALGNVVHSLFKGAKHIPYRDSKLTMVLRDTFASPRAYISLVVNVSPTVLTVEETLSSLYFADKVKAMKVGTASSHPQDEKTEEAYLAALREHDAVLADIHIFACENELEGRQATFLPQAAALLQERNPLFSSGSRTAVPAGKEKTAAMTALCQHFQAIRGQRDVAGRTARFLKEQHKQAKEEALREYLRARGAVKTELREVTTAVQALQQQAEGREAQMLRVLQTSHDAYTEARARRQRLDKQRQSLLEESQALQGREAQAAAQMRVLERERATGPALSGGEAQAAAEREAERSQTAAWEAGQTRLPLAVELAQLREQWMTLYVGNARHASAHNGSAGAADVETWLRSAVWTMAGNAVAQSMRRQRKRPQAVGEQPPQQPPPHSNPGFLRFVDANRPPKYWTQKRMLEVGQRRPNPLRHSIYDDPYLEETIAAFMDMGGGMWHLRPDGTRHRRLFYVVERHGRRRLCWDEEDHRQQQALRWRSAGHVELGDVRRILLGQSTPAFANGTARDDFFASFSLEYSSGGRSSLKYLDLICTSVRDMETWVVGLSQATGLYPAYAGTSQPDSVDTGEEGALPVEAELSPAALRLTRDWHIPASVLVETTAQVNERRVRRASQTMVITPGELATVTKLGIFRGCALWLYLRSEGLVEHPGNRLYCYIECKENKPPGASTGAATTPIGLSNSSLGSAARLGSEGP